MEPLDRMIGDVFQHPAEVIAGIEHVDRGGSFTPCVESREQLVFPPEPDRARGAFGGVAFAAGAAVAQAQGQRILAAKRVAYRSGAGPSARTASPLPRAWRRTCAGRAPSRRLR